MEKYYFISFEEMNSEAKKYTLNECINIHPLLWQMENHFVDRGLGSTFEKVLISWNEIEKYQYDSFINWQKTI